MAIKRYLAPMVPLHINSQEFGSCMGVKMKNRRMKKAKAKKEITGKNRIQRELEANGRDRIRENTEKGTGEEIPAGQECVGGEKDAVGESVEYPDRLHVDKPSTGKLEKCVDNPETDGSQEPYDAVAEELKELKAWFFQENIRMEMLRKEIEEGQAQLERDKGQFEAYVTAKESSLEMDRKRLEQENRFFDQKMKILQGGFEQLEEDRRRFQKEKDKFDACKEVYGETQDVFKRYEMTEMLFRGVNSFLALKKRYKDLIKMFHPDNVAGDHEMVQLINREYEELKKAYEVEMQA